MDEIKIPYRNMNDKIRRLVNYLRRYFKGKHDFNIGIYTILAGQKLIKSYYKTHKNSPELIEWRNVIFKNLSEFKKDLEGYEIKL